MDPRSVGHKLMVPSLGVNDLLIMDREEVSMEQVILDSVQEKLLGNLINEQRFSGELAAYGLPMDNKLMLHGSSGCGKTMVAKAIAKALDRELLVLDLSSVVSARIGETSQRLKMVFDRAAKGKSVLFLDEFDQIGTSRHHQHRDVGEMQRLVNTLIQLIDYFPQESLLIAATNHLEVLDTALLRRFQLKIGFVLPTKPILDNYYDGLLETFPSQFSSIERKYGISFAEARDTTFTQVKAAIIRKLEKQTINPTNHG